MAKATGWRWGRGLGILAGCLLLGGLAGLASHPVLRDVTTDPADPPCLEAPEISVDLARPLGEAARRKLSQAYPGLHGMLVSGLTVAELATKVREVLVADGLEPSELAGPGTADEILLHAVATTRWLRFRDDVLVRCRQEEAGVRVDLRSASRVGKSDLGVNAARIRRLLAALAAALRPRKGPAA